jgi:uncharacterized protein (TIRG00374 family)
MKRTLLIIASILVSLVVLWVAVQDVPLTEVGQNLSQIDLVWSLICLLLVFLGLWARGVRWRGLLDNRIPLKKTFHISNIMFMLNYLPLRLGEVARTALAAREGVPFMTAATSVVVERLVDTVFVVIMLSFSLARLPQAPPEAARAAALFGVAALAAFVILIGLARYPQIAEQILDWLDQRLPFMKRLPVRRLLSDVLTGLKPLTHLRSALHLIGWTLIAWAFSFSGYYAAQRALGLANIDFLLNAFLSVSLIAFSIAIPLSLASIGPFQAAARLGGTAVGLTPEAAFALGVLYHVITFLGYSALGVLGLVTMGVSLSDVTKVKDEA